MLDLVSNKMTNSGEKGFCLRENKGSMCKETLKFYDPY